MGELLLVHSLFKKNKFPASVAALLLSGLVLFLSVVGASTTLHKLLHADSGALNHSCAVTLFAKGQVASVDLAPIRDSFVPGLIGVRLVENSFTNPVADVRLTPGRAPPSC